MKQVSYILLTHGWVHLWIFKEIYGVVAQPPTSSPCLSLI